MSDARAATGGNEARSFAAGLIDTRRLAGVAALLLGLLFVGGVGFAGPQAIHNAAHDGRHSMAFPCH